MKVLWIKSSPREESYSTRLTESLIGKLRDQFENISLTVENLSTESPAHLSLMQLQSFFTPLNHLSEEQKECLKQSDYYIDQIFSHDMIIVSFPVWNFSVPSALKAWIDQIVRVGKTFQYIDSKPHGLVGKKKVFLVSARGGIYPENLSDVNAGPVDFSTALMKTVLSYIGLSEVVELRVDGLAIPGVRESAFEKALGNLNEIK